MAKQGKLPEQFKLTRVQERFHEGSGRRQFIRGPLKDRKAIQRAMKEMRNG